MLGFIFQRLYGLSQNLFILLPPTVEHVHISLDHRDRRPELVGSIRHKSHLTFLILLHIPEQIVERDLYTLKILVSGMYNLLVVIRGQMGYGFLQIVYLVVIHRLLAEFFRRHRQIIQRFQSSSDIRCPEQRNKQYYSLHPQQYNARNLYDIPKDLNVISVLLLI